jgi:hypothetical protein
MASIVEWWVVDSVDAKASKRGLDTTVRKSNDGMLLEARRATRLFTGEYPRASCSVFLEASSDSCCST